MRPHRIKWHDPHSKWHDMTCHTIAHPLSPHNQPHYFISPPQATSWHQNRSHHHHGTAKEWFGHRAGRSPCAHSIGKFFLCYIFHFSSETSAPPSPALLVFTLPFETSGTASCGTTGIFKGNLAKKLNLGGEPEINLGCEAGCGLTVSCPGSWSDRSRIMVGKSLRNIFFEILQRHFWWQAQYLWVRLDLLLPRNVKIALPSVTRIEHVSPFAWQAQ